MPSFRLEIYSRKLGSFQAYIACTTPAKGINNRAVILTSIQTYSHCRRFMAHVFKNEVNKSEGFSKTHNKIVDLFANKILSSGDVRRQSKRTYRLLTAKFQKTNFCKQRYLNIRSCNHADKSNLITSQEISNTGTCTSHNMNV